jgi:hypothetical protein
MSQATKRPSNSAFSVLLLPAIQKAREAPRKGG